MIVLLLLGSGVVGWLVWERQKEIQAYELAMAEGGEVEQLMIKAVKRARKYTNDKKREASEGIKGSLDDEESVPSYIRSTAQDSYVRWGAVTIGKPKPKDNVKGFDDVVYSVKQSDKDDTVMRGKIANLFYKLETLSRKLKVTDIDLRLGDNVKDEEVPVDEYNVDFEVTVRKKKDEKKR